MKMRKRKRKQGNKTNKVKVELNNGGGRRDVEKVEVGELPFGSGVKQWSINPTDKDFEKWQRQKVLKK